MAEQSRHDSWQAGDSYDAYMGRWSAQVAGPFLDWLAPAPGLDWLEVGCGTGALTAQILQRCAPRTLLGVEPSAGFLARARERVSDDRVSFEVGDAQALAAGDASVDLVVSGLVLNFVADRQQALAEMRRVARPGSTVAFYVWDYPGGGIEFMRAFWTAAAALDPKASELTEGTRFPFCTRDGLVALAAAAGLTAIASEKIEAPTLFRDFADFWHPFTLGTGPAPGYCMSLDPDSRERLRARLEARLPPAADGTIRLSARAWGIRGVVG